MKFQDVTIASRPREDSRAQPPQEAAGSRLFDRLIRLRTTLAIVFALITIVPVTTLAVWMDRTALRKVEQSVLDRHLMLAQHMASGLSAYAERVESAFRLAHGLDPDEGTPPVLIEHLRSLGLRGVYWVREADHEVVAQMAAEAGARPSDLTAVMALAEPSGTTFSDVQLDEAGRPTIFLAARHDHSLIAIGALSTDYFVKIQQRVHFGETGHAAIVDQVGKVLAHPKASLAKNLTDLSELGPIRRMMSGETGVTRFYSEVKMDQMIAGFTAIPPLGWGIMVVQPIKELEQRAEPERIAVLVTGLIGIVVAGAASWAFAGYLSRSIMPIVDAARANARGRLGTEIGALPRFAPTELRQLASSFNLMAREIRAAYRRVSQFLEAARQAEADYRAIFENASEGIYRSTPEGRLVRANPALVELCGYRSEDELLGALTDIAEQWYVDPARRAEFVQIMEEDGRVTDFVSEIYRHGTKERIWVSENARAIHDDEGHVLCYEGSVIDITERRRGEDAARRALAAESANRAKSEFLTTLSHELRTPLNAILGFSELMQRETYGPLGSTRYKGYAKDIHVSGLHLLNLINDLLDISKIEGKRYEIHDDTLVLADSVREVVRLIGPDARDKQIDVEVELEPRPELLRADARAFKQMVLNLLSNAVKFTLPGGRILIRVQEVDEECHVVVEDSGIGIEPQHLDEVLRPFGQIESSLSRRESGTGLGLPIVKSLIELHGGRMDLRSAPGTGTTVTLAFPAERRVEAPCEAEAVQLQSA